MVVDAIKQKAVLPLAGNTATVQVMSLVYGVVGQIVEGDPVFLLLIPEVQLAPDYFNEGNAISVRVIVQVDVGFNIQSQVARCERYYRAVIHLSTTPPRPSPTAAPQRLAITESSR